MKEPHQPGEAPPQIQHSTAAEMRQLVAIPAPEPDGRLGFPLDALPLNLRNWIAEVHSTHKLPIDYLAASLVTVAGAAIGTTRAIQTGPGHIEPPVLYTVLIGPPGSNKSPSMDLATAPFWNRDKTFQAEYDRDREAFESELADWEAAGHKERGPRPQEPRRRVAVLSTLTTEAVTEELRWNPRGILIHVDEAGAWVLEMDQYHHAGRGSDRQFWLKAWSSRPINRLRKGAPAVLVPRPFLSVLGGMAPTGLRGLVQNLDDPAGDGFLPRLWLVYPDLSPVQMAEGTISQEARVSFDRMFSGLFGLRTDEGQSPRVLSLEGPTAVAWAERFAGYAEELNTMPELDPLRGHLSKMPSFAARFALILAEMRYALEETWYLEDRHGDEVRTDDVVHGWRLADYALAHAAKALNRLQQGATIYRQQAVLDWLRAHRDKYPEGVPAWQVARANVGGLETTAEAEAILLELEAKHYGEFRAVPPGEGGGRPSKLFCLLDDSTEKTRKPRPP